MAGLSYEILIRYSPLPIFFPFTPLEKHIVNLTSIAPERDNLKRKPNGKFVRWIGICFFCPPCRFLKIIIVSSSRTPSCMKVNPTGRNHWWWDGTSKKYSGILITRRRNIPSSKINSGRWEKLLWNGWGNSQQVQVRMYQINGRVDFHMVQPMGMNWLDFCTTEATSVW